MYYKYDVKHCTINQSSKQATDTFKHYLMFSLRLFHSYPRGYLKIEKKTKSADIFVYNRPLENL